MRAVTIARNYAEALFDLGEQSGQAELYAELIDAVASAVETSPRIQAVLMSPRVPKREKSRYIGVALQESPREFTLFLQAVVKRGRQQLLRQIASEYLTLLDVKLGRVRAGVTLAKAPDEALRQSIAENLSRVMGKEVLATFYTDPAILGGTIVRVGDQVHDGSVRRRMTNLRRQLLSR